MIRDVFRFSDKRANELMTHRRDLIILHPDDTQEKVMKTIEEEHYSKYLLVDERKDEIIGVVSVKDIILMIGSKKLFNLREIARPPLFIPESLYANKIHVNIGFFGYIRYKNENEVLIRKLGGE